MNENKVAIGLGVATLVLFILWQKERERAQCFADAFAYTAGFYPPATVANLPDDCKALLQIEFF